jgi:prohibitin 2
LHNNPGDAGAGDEMSEWTWKHTILAVLGVVVLTVLVSSWKVVSPGYVGVRVTLGSVSAEALPAGLYWKWPLITSIHEISTQQQTIPDKASCFSKDMQTVTVEVTTLIRIPADQAVGLYVKYHGDAYEALVKPRVQENLKQVSALYTAEELVQKREELREKSRTRVVAAVGDIIAVVDMNIVNVDLTDELEKAIEAKMVQQQESLAMQFKVDREKKQAEITVVQATAEAESVRIKGAAIAGNPKIIDLEVVKKWDGKSPTTVVIGNGQASTVLPLVGGK